MKTIDELEERVANWYKQIPHLPKGGQKWLAENIWWLVLIGVIIGALGALSLVLVTLFGGVFLAGAVFLYSAQYGGLALLIAAIMIGAMLLNVIVAAMSISPLKDKQKKGWTLLFIALLLTFVSMLLEDLLRFSFFGIIEDVLRVAVGGYFLFEVRDWFGRAAVVTPTKGVPVFVPPATSK